MSRSFASRPWQRRLLAIGAVLSAMAMHVAAQFGMLLSRPDFAWSKFRNFGAGDQLSYAAIATNAAEGNFDAVEPFTETGSIYYPRLYYMLLGVVARVFGVGTTTAWAVTGLVVQLLLVAAVSIACILITRRLWTGVLGAIPFMLGTFSALTSDAWFTAMNSHAVLWGPFAVMFPLNGEAAGLAAGSAALLLLLVAYLRSPRRWLRLAMPLVACAIIGTLANVQTYSFLSVVFLGSFAVAAVTLVLSRKLWVGILSVALLPVVLFVGPVVAETAGQLATLLFGLTPALPGLVLAIIRTKGYVAVCGAVAVIFSLPSVLGTARGLAAEDPFLVYRVASSNNLAVTFPEGLIGSLALTVPLLVILLAGLRAKNALWIGFPIAAITSWVLLSTNDRWGANQEPYRFWIDSMLLIAVVTLPVLITVMQEFLTRRQERWIAVGALAVILGLVAVSLVDLRLFFSAGRVMDLASFEGPRYYALQEAAASTDGGLILMDPCIDPLSLKLISGEPITFMNGGMAWSDHHEAINSLYAGRGTGTLDLDAANTAGVDWVIMDSNCGFDWEKDYEDNLSDPVSASYVVDGDGGTITIARLEP